METQLHYWSKIFTYKGMLLGKDLDKEISCLSNPTLSNAPHDN